MSIYLTIIGAWVAMLIFGFAFTFMMKRQGRQNCEPWWF